MFHYTCRHGAEGIERTGFIETHYQPLLGVDLAWFTDLDPPDRDALGLTSHSLVCDRLKWRCEVRHTDLISWTAYRRILLRAGHRRGVHMLEAAPRAAPVHWWVSTRGVPVTQWPQLTSVYGPLGAGVVIPAGARV